MAMRFQPIKPKKISCQIADQIRESILAGDIVPGDKLPPEGELAEMFGVSRPSVRGALNILASNRMVMSPQSGVDLVLSLVESGQGNALSELIRTQQILAVEVMQVQKCMESWAAFYAAQRALPENLLLMDEILLHMEKNLSDQLISEDLDSNLHIVITRAAHNIVWLHLMHGIIDTIKELQRRVWQADNLTLEEHNQLFQHHFNIVKAIRNRNAERARRR
jgi:GntR family transcriptional regulator, transcriptional repressor for pyruvate dehydrogenase complex